MRIYTLTIILIFSGISLAIGQGAGDFFFDEARLSTNMAMPGGDGESNGAGFGIGLYHSFKKEQRLNIVVGFDYNYSKSKYPEITDVHDVKYHDVSVSISSLYIPVTLRLHELSFGKDSLRQNKLFLEAGLHAGAIWHDKIKATPDNEEFGTEEEELEYAMLEPADWGAHLGVGLRFPYKGVDILAKVDYLYGFTDLYNAKGTSIYNRLIRLSVGINFDPARK